MTLRRRDVVSQLLKDRGELLVVAGRAPAVVTGEPVRFDALRVK